LEINPLLYLLIPSIYGKMLSKEERLSFLLLYLQIQQGTCTMPSKHSERLQEAINYIKSGETEIAREIILEIIQDDPAYEKAWIWLVETVPDRENKVDILKTRLEEYPDTSPLSKIALDKIAPEVLGAIVPRSEAIIYPEGMEPRSDITEDEIQYNVTADETMNSEDWDDDHDFLSMITDEEDEVSEEDISQLTESDELFAEVSPAAPVEEELDFNFFEDIEGEDLEADDLDMFLQNEKDIAPPQQPVEGALDLEAWLAEEGVIGEKSPADLEELATLLGETEEDAEFEEEPEIDDPALRREMTVKSQSEPLKPSTSTSSSNPFLLTDNESIDLLGIDVVQENQSLDDLFNTSDSQEIDFSLLEDQELTEDDFFTPSQEIPEENVRPGDLEASLADDLRAEVLGDSLSYSQSRQQRQSQQMQSEQQKAKKKKETSSTFILGCSVLGLIIFVALLGLGYLVWQQAQNPPPPTEVPPTAVPTETPEPTATYPLVAPWLDQEESDVQGTPVPGSEILGETALIDWVAQMESVGFFCEPEEVQGEQVVTTCTVSDEAYDVIAFLAGTPDGSMSNVQMQVLSLQTDSLVFNASLNTLLSEVLSPVVTFPISGSLESDARTWFLSETANMIQNDATEASLKAFGGLTIHLQYSYFLRIDL
jgi:hypothetical protein